MFKDNMRYLRKLRGLGQPEIAARLGYKSFTTIQKWEDGTSIPPYDVIAKLANILETTVEDLMSSDPAKVNSAIPVLGTVRGGAPIFAEQNIVDYEIPGYLDSEEYFCLDVIGDSMKNARIMSGDRIFVHKQNTLKNREIGVVLIGDEATVKRVIFERDFMILQPENEAYSPIVLTQKDQEEKGVKILGKVVYNKIRI